MQEIEITTADDYSLAAKWFTANTELKNNKVLIINSATSVAQGMYQHYALFMADKGYEVITYDYRGIAASRPKTLRGFKASFTIWGQKDFAAVLSYCQHRFSRHKTLVIGHSIGGILPGMTPKCNSINGLITVGAQSAYYKDWAKKERRKIYLLWHVFFPFVTSIFGYFPGKRLNLLEDTPKGVITQWNNRQKHEDIAKALIEGGTPLYYDTYTAKLLTLGIADDPIGTYTAIERIHVLYGALDKEISMLKPEDTGVEKIGHFGFFSRRFKDTLWDKTLIWFNAI